MKTSARFPMPASNPCVAQSAARALWLGSNPRQNWMILGVLCLFAMAVFLNVVLALAIAPHLLKALSGIESPFTISGPYALRNSTFLCAALAITYAILDPLLKAVYALRCFHGESKASGADLKAAWAALLLLSIVLSGSGATRRSRRQT